MGKLYQLIEKQAKELKAYQDLEKQSYMASKTFPKTYKAMENSEHINSFIALINKNKEKYFGSVDAYNNFLKENDNLFSKIDVNEIPHTYRSEHLYTGLFNYEVFFDNMEKAIGSDKVDSLCNDFNTLLENKSDNIIKPLKPYTNDIKKELDGLLKDDINLEKYKEDLDFVSDHIIEKENTLLVDVIIDDINLGRDKEALKSLEDYAIKNNLNPEEFKNYNTSNVKLDIMPNSKKIVEDTKELGKNVKYPDELKNKLLKLDEKIKEIGVPSKYALGEEGDKFYGLCDYFEKAKEITALVGTYKNKTTPEEKINQIKEISLKKEELEVIEKKYDELFAYIKENFDLEKIGLPGNVYSGRKHDFYPDHVEAFTPNLPKKWDEENAAIPVILNGFCQLKGAALNSNVSLLEYMNNPVDNFLKGATKVAEDIDKKFYLPRSEENTLGKRIAHTLITTENSHAALNGYIISARGMEFLNNVDELNEETIPNYISSNIGVNYYYLFDHSVRKMYMNNNEPDYDSIKNLFAMGDKTDKLYEISENYYNTNVEKGSVLDYKYFVTHDNNLRNPKEELDRVLNTLKDYTLERRRIIRNPEAYVGEDEQLEEKIEYTQVILGAKQYFNDYLVMNKKDIVNINKNDSKAIMDFLKDPVTTFTKKFKNELDYSNEFINELKDEYKANNNRFIENKGVDYNLEFSLHNTEGQNRGKSITQIMHDNRGGFLERNFGWSSKEYKALTAAVKAATDPDSPTRGDYGFAKISAIKYLEHKLPEGVNEDTLSANEKRRIQFCRSIISTCDAIENQDNVINNQDLNNDNNIINNDNFQNQINKDIDLENNNNMDDIDNSNNIIENNLDMKK